jgi:hypothetical protein
MLPMVSMGMPTIRSTTASTQYPTRSARVLALSACVLAFAPACSVWSEGAGARTTDPAPRRAADGPSEILLTRLHLAPADLEDAPLHEVLGCDGAWIDIVVLPGALQLKQAELEHWVLAGSNAVCNWFGHFPVKYLFVVVKPTRGRGVGDGLTVGAGDTAGIRIPLGERASTNALRQDWVLVHEMVHTAIPNLPEQNHWFEEGAATYVEAVARLRAGMNTVDGFWYELVDTYGNGVPQKGEGGLDDTPSWGRTYYGGAIYFLLADIAIRERTEGKKSLRDSFAGIVEELHGITNDSDMDHVIAAADKASGVPVFRELYDRMAHHPEPVDLKALWKELGVAVKGRSVTYDDGAPKAWVRKSYEH